MTNEEANTQLGIKSRHLAFALVDLGDKDWRGSVDKLQEALYDYGKEIAILAALSSRQGLD